jgi:hypothetical protein
MKLIAGLMMLATAAGYLAHQANPQTASATIGSRGQLHHVLVSCPDSPVPGMRPANMQCAGLAHLHFSRLPSGDLYLRIESFATHDAALSASAALSEVVEAAGKVWLLSISRKGERSPGGIIAAEIGPIPPFASAGSYTLDIFEAAFDDDMRRAVSRAVHTHPGPEIFYIFTGSQCLETPAGAMRAGPGEGMVAPANTPMQLNIVGPKKREALFMVLHDAKLPWTTASEWQPRGLCANPGSTQ